MHYAHEEQQLRLRIWQMRWETHGVLSLELQRPDGAELPAWEPGAHLDLRLPGVITRQYSLCGSPADRGSWRIAVLREPNSKGGSAAVHERVRPGDLVEVVGPRNNFRLADAAAYLFIAGGIGITPLLPMIETVSAAGANWSLLYGGRRRDSMAFVDELAGYGGRVQLRPQDECGLLDLDGLLAASRPGTLVYCCGPEPLLAAVESRCAAWPKGSLHVERFAAKPQAPADPGGAQDFELVLARTGRTICVRAGKSILEALEAEGIEPPNSCREGICGTCETAVLDGVPEHRDSLLSEDERAANDTMMICVGRALSEMLTLDL